MIFMNMTRGPRVSDSFILLGGYFFQHSSDFQETHVHLYINYKLLSKIGFLLFRIYIVHVCKHQGISAMEQNLKFISGNM